MEQSLMAPTKCLPHLEPITWLESPDMPAEYYDPQDGFLAAQTQSVGALGAVNKIPYTRENLFHMNFEGGRNELAQRNLSSLDLPSHNHSGVLDTVPPNTSNQALNELGHENLILAEVSHMFSQVVPGFSPSPRFFPRNLRMEEQVSKIVAATENQIQTYAGKLMEGNGILEEPLASKKHPGVTTEMMVIKPSDRITTRRFISPKVTQSYVHQFRVRKTKSSKSSNPRRITPTDTERKPPNPVTKHKESGSRKICLHCHFLNKKCDPLAEDSALLAGNTPHGPFDNVDILGIRCMNCAEPRISRQLFCRVQMELLLPKFLFREPRIVSEDPDAALKIGHRVLSGDFGPTMGTAFDITRSDFWFKIPFHKLPAIKNEDLDRINIIYRANLPILPNLGMMKRQTRVIVGFAEDFIKEHSPKWQLVSSAFDFVKIGYCLFQTITKEMGSKARDLPAADLENRKKHIASLSHYFTTETSKFIETLDCALHKKPNTTDWAAIVTSTCLIFDMFQYMFYLLQKGHMEFDISDLRRFRGVLFTRYSVWGGLRLLDNKNLLRCDSRLHQYYRSYTDFWQKMNALKVYETVKPILPAKVSEIGLRYSNAVPLPLPLHVVQTGYCRTAANFSCEDRKDRAMCSGCFMKMMDRIYPKPAIVP